MDIGSTSWKLSRLLSAFHRLFLDSLTLRDGYCIVLDDDCPLIPLEHCPTRWMENVSDLERALELLPNMKAFVKAVQKEVIPNLQTKTFYAKEVVC